MKTADFLPATAFQAYLDRRKTPGRVLILAIFALVCSTLATVLELEVQTKEKAAAAAEAPDEIALKASNDLDRIFGEMTRFAVRLNPLTDHLGKPTIGRLIAGMPEAVGRYVKLEEIRWDYVHPADGKKKVDPKLDMTVTAIVRGDEALLTTGDRLREFTGYTKASTGKSEPVPDRRDALRVEFNLNGDELVTGNKKPKTGP